MKTAQIVLMIVVAILLLVVLIDRGRQVEQMRAIDANVSALKRTIEQQALMARFQPATSTQAPAPVGKERDGRKKLGVNFLLPLDRSTFDPGKVGGTLRELLKPSAKLNDLIDNALSTRLANSLINAALCNGDPTDPDLLREGLAESMVVTDEWRTYVFALRPGVVWQRPAIATKAEFSWLDRDVPLTAHDFVFYTDLIRNPDVNCPALRGYYENLASVKALDDLTLEVRWKESLTTNLNFSAGLVPAPRHVYGSYPDGSPIPVERIGSTYNAHWFDEAKQCIGVGAYRLESFEAHKSVSFIADPRYWGPGLHFQRITWDGIIEDPAAVLAAFKNGQVDVLDGRLTPQQYRSEILDQGEPRFLPEPRHREGPFGWQRVRGLNNRSIIRFIGWNLRRPQFSDRETRQALARCMPKERIIKEVFQGLGVAQVGPLDPSNPYYDGELRDWAFDIEAARRQFADAGWKDSDGDGWLDREREGKRSALRFKVTYYGPNATWPKVLAIYRDLLKQVGIDLIPDPVDAPELDRRQDDKDFDAICSGWASGTDVDFDQIWHSRFADEPRSSNFVGFKSERADIIATELRRTFDDAKFRALAVEFQRLIHDEQPYLYVRNDEYTFTWHNRRSGAEDKRQIMDGVVPGFDRNHPFSSRDKSLWFIRKD